MKCRSPATSAAARRYPGIVSIAFILVALAASRAGAADPDSIGDKVRGAQLQIFIENDKWHRTDRTGAANPEGWANQVPNEPAFLVSYLHKRRYGAQGDSFDFIPHLGASVGTVATFARAGGIVRLGVNKTGFGPDRIEPGGAMLQRARESYNKGNRETFEWFVFAGLDARLVAYNIFLDGTVFHESPSVDRRPVVYDVFGGLSVRWKFICASLTSVLRSEEFTTPRGGGGRQRFYSMNVGFEF